MKDKLRVDPPRCLHGRHRDYLERPCHDVCPNKAVHLNPLEIDYGLCNGCGICAGVCPSGALSIKESYLAEVSKVASDTGKELRIRCSHVEGRCTSVTCLGALDYAFFAELCIKGSKDLGLLSGNCEDCQTAPGGELVRAAVNTANNILCLYGRKERVLLTGSVDRRDLESDSKRAMFRGMGRAITRFIPEMDEAGHAPDPGPVPARRQRSIKIIEGLEKGQRRSAHDMPMPFTGKEIAADRCDGCDGFPKCVSLCPTDALEYSGLAGITFTAARCIGCGLCESACHKGAVKSFTLRSGQVEELWRTKTLKVFETQECEGCGEISIGINDGLCQGCHQRERKLGWVSV